MTMTQRPHRRTESVSLEALVNRYVQGSALTARGVLYEIGGRVNEQQLGDDWQKCFDVISQAGRENPFLEPDVKTRSTARLVLLHYFIPPSIPTYNAEKDAETARRRTSLVSFFAEDDRHCAYPVLNDRHTLAALLSRHFEVSLKYSEDQELKESFARACVNAGRRWNLRELGPIAIPPLIARLTREANKHIDSVTLKPPASVREKFGPIDGIGTLEEVMQLCGYITKYVWRDDSLKSLAEELLVIRAQAAL